MNLGIDIGGVIISRPPEGDGGDTSFIGGSLETALRTPPWEGCFDAIARLVRAFEGRVWLVSKCRRRVEEKTRAWLVHHRFFEETGVPSDHLRFCLERPQKADIARGLRLTHFIDDRLDVLECLRPVVPTLVWFGGRAPAPGWLSVAVTWPSAVEILTAPDRSGE